MNKQIIGSMKEAIEVALIVKARGHDCFVEYSAHVNEVSIRLYLNGWDQEKVFAAEGSGADFDSRVAFAGTLAPANPAATIREAVTSVLEIIAKHELELALEVRGENY